MRTNIGKFTKIIFLLIFILGSIVQSSPASEKLFTLEKIQNGYRVHFKLPPLRFEVNPNLRRRIPFFNGGHLLPQPGKPMLPAAAVSLIIPRNSNPTIHILQKTTEELSNITIPSFPDTLVSTVKTGLTSGPVQDTKAEWFGVPVQTFKVYPLGYDSLRHTLRVIKEMVFEVKINAANFTIVPVPRPLSQAQVNLLKVEALNFNQVYFQTRPKPLRKVLSGWYNPNFQYVKFYVSTQNIFRVTYRDLVDSLGLPSNMNPEKFKIFYKGRQIPIEVMTQDSSRFQPGDGLRFYGDWNRGEHEFYDLYTDTSVYWFSYQGGKGERLPLKNVAPHGGFTAKSFYRKAHFEEDHIYYFGDNDLSIFSSGVSPGEGWIWERIYAGDAYAYTVRANNLTAGNWPDSLVIRLRGITNDAQNPDHHIRIYLNESRVGDFTFDGLQEYLFKAAIPEGLLKEGRNTVRIESAGDTGASRDAVYLDWMELYYHRAYVASGNFLLAQSPPGVKDSLVYFQFNNFHTPDIIVYDLTDSVRLDSLNIGAYGTDKYYVAFSDSITKPKQYLAEAASALKKPDRIILDRPSDLKSAQQGADYIIITAAPFIRQAEQLASYRESHNGFRTAVVDVQDIFDEFSYGIFSPPAIRDFLKYAYSNWENPPPSYVLFLGDGTWDYKHHLENSVNRNFVPPIANPVSDNRYVAFDPSDPHVPQMMAGRLPVKSVKEAETVVGKIVQYESSPPAEWKKRVTFLNGGVNGWEQSMFKTESESLIRDYVTPSPFGGSATRIYKETEGRLVGELRPEIMSAIDKGCLWFNFMGHAGSDTWDLMLQNEDIPQLTNGEKLPFITSMTCHTARFANPFLDSFGELFVTVADRGAIAFWGTTGWGYIYQDNFLLTSLFQFVLHDTLLDLGQATTLARIRLWRELGNGPTNLSSLDQYTLLGDPALRLSVPKVPDIAVLSKNIARTPDEVTQKDSLLNVHVTLLNYGLFVEDSVRVAVQISNESGQIISQKTILAPPFGFADSLRIRLSLSGRAGVFRLQVEANPNGRINEGDRTNNRAGQTFSVYSTEISISYPPDFAVLNTSEPKLQINVPEQLPGNQAITYDFELDTTRRFDSPAKISAENLEGNFLVSAWRVPVLLKDGAYFWHSRMRTGETFSNWVTGVFQIEQKFSGFGWGQSFGTGFGNVHLSGVLPIHSSFQLAPDSSRATYLEVQSAGHDDGNRAYLIVNFRVVNNEHTRGINLLALNGQTGQMLAPPRVYDTYASEAQSDSLADYIDSLPEGSVVLAGIMDDGTFHLTEKAYRALESIGSRYCRQVRFRDSWAIIGRKGAPAGTVPEKWVPVGGGYAIVRDTLLNIRVQQGKMISEPIGPSSKWTTARFSGQWGQNGASIQVRILGRKSLKTSWDTLLTVPLSDSTLSLANISAGVYPVLKLQAGFASADGLHSPRLTAWKVRYRPVPDLTTRPKFLSIHPDSVLEGDQVALSGEIFNVGMTASDSVQIKIGVANKNAVIDTVSSLWLPAIQPGGEADFSSSFSTAGYVGPRKAVVMIDPERHLNELSAENNRYELKFFVRKDTLRPAIYVTFNNREILPGDWVSTHPKISIFVEDNSPLALADTGFVKVFLDGQPQYYANPAGILEFRTIEKNGKSGAEVFFTPALGDGKHSLDVAAKDATLNTSAAHMEFVVKSEFAIQRLLNYPNPTAGETDFTYYLTQPTDRVELSLYTLSGRKIYRAEDLPGQVGPNIFHWNGLDADGDPPANGVYLYRLQAGREGKTITALGKLIVIR